MKIVFGILLLAISVSLQSDVCAATKQERLRAKLHKKLEKIRDEEGRIVFKSLRLVQFSEINKKGKQTKIKCILKDTSLTIAGKNFTPLISLIAA